MQKTEDLNRNNLIGGLMTKIQEYISFILSLIGIYLILVYFSLFEYTPNLKEIIPTHMGLLVIGLLSIFVSNALSPTLWEKILKK